MGWEPLPSSDKDPVALGGGLDAVVRRLGGGAAPTMLSVVQHWAEIIGADLAPLTLPTRIDKDCLTVSTADSSATTEIRFRQAQVVERIAALTGDTSVARVRVTIARATPPGA